MKYIILFFLSMIALFSCKQKACSTFIPVTINPMLICKASIGIETSNLTQQKTIISNQNDFNNLMNLMSSVFDVNAKFTETTIDFNNFRVLVVVDQLYYKGGGTIDITNVIENQNEIVVTVQNVTPSNDTDALNRPFHIVKIPNINKPVIFQ